MHKMGGIKRLWDQSTKFGTVIVFDEVINFSYRPIRNSFRREFFVPRGGGVGTF